MTKDARGILIDLFALLFPSPAWLEAVALDDDKTREAVALHLEGLRRDGDPVPPPETTAVEVDVPLTVEANMSAAV
ncbi:MAG: hypothetical protein J4F98_05830 [Acidobacteria bacterium]|nr:hypothetical protein [Acidobacteriota bacterium]